MEFLKRLDSRQVSANGNIQLPLSSLPPGCRVRAINLDVSVAYTKTGADTLPSERFAQWFALVHLGQFVNLPGPELQAVADSKLGRKAARGADIPGSGTAGVARFQVIVPFRDVRQPDPDDGSVPTEMLWNDALMLTMSPGNVHGVGTLNVDLNGFTINAHVDMVSGSGVPQLVQLGYIDVGGQTFEVPAGAYADLFACKAGMAANISEAEISTASFSGDGKQFLDNVTHGALIQAYNTLGVRDSAAELVIGATNRVPLAFMDQSGKSNISKQPYFESRARAQLQGSLTTFRVVYARAMPKDGSVIASAYAATGMVAENYRVATASGTPLLGLDGRGPINAKSRMLSRILAGKAA